MASNPAPATVSAQKTTIAATAAERAEIPRCTPSILQARGPPENTENGALLSGLSAAPS